MIDIQKIATGGAKVFHDELTSDGQRWEMRRPTCPVDIAGIREAIGAQPVDRSRYDYRYVNWYEVKKRPDLRVEAVKTLARFLKKWSSKRRHPCYLFTIPDLPQMGWGVLAAAVNIKGLTFRVTARYEGRFWKNEKGDYEVRPKEYQIVYSTDILIWEDQPSLSGLPR